LFVTHLESTADGSRLDARALQTVHGGKPLLVRYDLARIARALPRAALRERPSDLWRWRELLPLPAGAEPVSLGETVTPLLRCPRLAGALGVRELWIKDESRLPTGSFKARGMAMAVSMARHFGVRHVAVPTAGNAGGALAAYAARAGMRCTVLMPHDTPLVNRCEVALHGARAFLVDGLIHECGAIVREGIERIGWFDMSTLREPYRIEGKKTMGLELAEQLGWRLPDVILYPTGGGTGLIGMHKAFAELRALGWLESDTEPRLFACQSDGCAPLEPAFEQGLEHGVPPARPHTIAAGIRVPKALGDFLILRAVRESRGRAMSAAEERLGEWMRLATMQEGISLCPESAACLGVLERALREGWIDPRERLVLFNTGAAQKYVEAIAVELPALRKDAVDWGVLR
jgi:threonine synthase